MKNKKKIIIIFIILIILIGLVFFINRNTGKQGKAKKTGTVEKFNRKYGYEQETTKY